MCLMTQTAGVGTDHNRLLIHFSSGHVLSIFYKHLIALLYILRIFYMVFNTPKSSKKVLIRSA